MGWRSFFLHFFCIFSALLFALYSLFFLVFSFLQLGLDDHESSFIPLHIDVWLTALGVHAWFLLKLWHTYDYVVMK